MATGDSKDVNALLAELSATAGELKGKAKEYDSIKAKVEELAGNVKTEMGSVKAAISAIEATLKRPGGTQTQGMTSSKAMVELIRKYHGASEEAKNLGIEAVKAYGMALDTQGGYLVPPDFQAVIIEKQVDMNPVLDLTWKISTGREIVQVPKESGAPTAYWVNDTGTRKDGQNDHKFGLEELKVQLLQTYVDIANTTLEDVPFDLEGFVARKIAIAQDSQIGAAFISGNGIGKPEGMLSAPSVLEAAGGGASAITADGLLSIGDEMKTAYDKSAVLLMKKKTRTAIRKLKDTTNQYLWQPALTQGAPQTFDGVPIILCADMPAIEANAYPVLYGDIGQAYMVAQRVGMTMKRDDVTQLGSGKTRFYFEQRIGGQVVNPDAICKLKIATSV